MTALATMKPACRLRDLASQYNGSRGSLQDETLMPWGVTRRGTQHAWPDLMLAVDDVIVDILKVHPLWNCVSGLCDSFVLRRLHKYWRFREETVAATVVEVEVAVYDGVHILHIDIVTSEMSLTYDGLPIHRQEPDISASI